MYILFAPQERYNRQGDRESREKRWRRRSCAVHGLRDGRDVTAVGRELPREPVARYRLQEWVPVEGTARLRRV